MKKNIRRYKLFPLLVFLLISPTYLVGQDISSRAPFVMEMPEIAPTRYTSPVIRLPMKDIPRLKFRVLEPFATDITYGNIIVTINGEGANRGCDKTRDGEGKVVICGKREDRLGGYILAKGKNIIEIRATDKKEREFYASYVVILGDKTAVVEKPDWTNGQAERFNGRKFAVIVGVSDYKFQDAGLKNLSYADDDANAIAAFLQTPTGGGFSKADIKLLLNQEATLGAVRAALLDTFKKAKADDLIFVFIAGHGAPDPLASQNLYFLLTDTKVVDMARTAFPMGELKQMLDTQVSAQRVVVMIDTCHSAGVNQKTKSIVTGRQLVREGDENNISNFFLTKQLFKQTGRAILTSSDVDEVSQESEKWGNHGVFTWAILDGLKGKADLNGDKLITAGELFQYTRANVQKATNFQQNPIALPGSATNLTFAFTQGNGQETSYSDINKQNTFSKESFQKNVSEKISLDDGYRHLGNDLIAENHLSEAQIVLDILKDKEYEELKSTRRGGSLDTTPYSKAEADVIAKVEKFAALGREKAELQKDEKEQGGLSYTQQQRLMQIENDIEVANKAFRQALDTLLKILDGTKISVGEKVAEIESQRNLQRTLSRLSRELNTGAVAIYTIIGTDFENNADKQADKDKTRSKFGWVILVTPDARKAYPIDVRDLEITVFQFRTALSSDNYDPQPLAEKLYKAIFQQTSDKQKTTLEADLAKFLGKYKDKTIMWSLDGVLRYIPTAALHDGEKYLIEKYRHIVFTKESLAYFNDEDSRKWQALGLGVSEGREGFNALPGAEKELNDIVRSSPNDAGIFDGTILLNKNFKKDETISLWRQGKYPVIHIASHFSFNSLDQTASFLLVGDGKLTFADIKDKDNLFGAVDLLTLSACDTAMSSNGKESEGFAYLAQQLGAKTVLASLWKVSDAGTPELMIRFYKLRSENPTLSKGEAFRWAQISLLGAELKNEPTTKRNDAQRNPNQKRTDVIDLSGKTIELPLFVKDKQKPFAHPHYWASFVLIGNWR